MHQYSVCFFYHQHGAVAAPKIGLSVQNIHALREFFGQSLTLHKSAIA